MLQAQYGSDLNSWSNAKPPAVLHPDESKEALQEHCVYAQQTTDVFIKSALLDSYMACKRNPNLHSA